MESIELFLWGHDQGYKYRRFSKLRVSYYIVQSYRILAACIIFFWIIWDAYYGADSLRHFAFFTTWDLYLTFTAFVLNFMATRTHHNDQTRVEGIEFIIWRCGVFIFETALTFETMTFVFSIVAHTIKDFKLEGLNLATMYAIHFLPLPMLLADFYMQKWLFRSHHIVPIFIILIVYFCINLAATKYYSIPIYEIVLEWDPVWVSTLVWLFSLFVFYFIFKFYKNITEKHYSTSNTTKKSNMHDNEFQFDRDGVEFEKLDEEIVVDPKEKHV